MKVVKLVCSYYKYEHLLLGVDVDSAVFESKCSLRTEQPFQFTQMKVIYHIPNTLAEVVYGMMSK